MLLARYLNGSTVAAARPTSRKDATQEGRLLVCPYHYLAAVADPYRVCVDRRILAHISRSRVLIRPLALPVTSYQRRTTSADS